MLDQVWCPTERVTGGAGMPGFVQIREIKTPRIDEVDALMKKSLHERRGLLPRRLPGRTRQTALPVEAGLDEPRL